MPRTPTGTMGAHIVKNTTTMAVCFKVTRRDGEIFGFTTHSRDLVISGLTYKADTGIQTTSVVQNLGALVDNSELIGFIKASGIDMDEVRAGLFNGAEVEKFTVDYLNPVSGLLPIEWGVLGEAVLNGNVFNTELRGGSQWLSLEALPLIQTTCRAQFGDAWQCKATVHSDNGTVTNINGDGRTITAAALVGARANDFYVNGRLKWTNGPNKDLEFNIADYVAATGVVVVIEKAVMPIGLGDTFTIYEGCGKTRADCQTKTGPGGVNNIANFDGEPDTPGNDWLLRIITKR